MHTPSHLGVRIGSHFNKNAYMHERTTIAFGIRIMGWKNLTCVHPFWCKPVDCLIKLIPLSLAVRNVSGLEPFKTGKHRTVIPNLREV